MFLLRSLILPLVGLSLLVVSIRGSIIPGLDELDAVTDGTEGYDPNGEELEYSGLHEVLGARENAGPAGFPGMYGAKGDIGSPGPAGSPGRDGIPGLPGDKGKRGNDGDDGVDGDDGNDGNDGLPGLKGQKGDTGSPGPPGSDGSQGFPGSPGEDGSQGPAGAPGTKGAKGDTGSNGASGLPGSHGSPGHDGVPGLPGDKGKPGNDGKNGLPGRDGKKGDTGSLGPRGSDGSPGLNGMEGQQGPRGPAGAPGINGTKGETGSPGRPPVFVSRGPVGPAGPPGPVGQPGFTGPKGEAGESCKETPNHSTGILLVRHSQDQTVPTCSDGQTKLWEGYSLLLTVGNRNPHFQDLGDAGSCTSKFSTIPFVACNTNNVCHYAADDDQSHWLTTPQMFPMSPLKKTDIKPYISRCVVCEVPAKVVAVHSKSLDIPDCPNGWSQLWIGYSFLMYTAAAHQGGGQSLSSSGSCLEKFRTSPVIQCDGYDGQCSFDNNELSFWLATIQDDQQFQEPEKQTFKARYVRNRISRCAVCMKKT